jgi:hypothetical protein
MIRVALKGLAQHRLRTVLTALAIVVGVATMSAAFTLSDTMRQASDALSSDSYGGTAAVVSAKTAYDRSVDGYTKNPTISAATLDAVRRVPQAGVAVGDLTNTQTRMLDRAGDPIGDGPYFGIGLDSRQKGFEQLTPFRLEHGRWATGASQVVIDAGTADKQHLKVGGTVAIAGDGPCSASASWASRASATSRRSAPRRPRCSTCTPRSVCSASTAGWTRCSWPAARARATRRSAARWPRPCRARCRCRPPPTTTASRSTA